MLTLYRESGLSGGGVRNLTVSVHVGPSCGCPHNRRPIILGLNKGLSETLRALVWYMVLYGGYKAHGVDLRLYTARVPILERAIARAAVKRVRIDLKGIQVVEELACGICPYVKRLR